MLKVFNTLSRKKEFFQPVSKKLVRIYSCGPTVYDFAHIGNFRSYLTADILYRYLKYLGYQVKLVKNITDVGHLTQADVEKGEDKIIAAAKKQAKTPQEIARFYEKAFLEDEAQFNILPASVYPRASENIPQMIAIIQELIKRGLAYEKNGSVFFDVSRFKNYGQLSGNPLDKLQTGVRLEPHPDKKNPWDFALWLKAEPDHLMQWDSPWSRGYPGWHIECSAMSLRYLSEVFFQASSNLSLTKACPVEPYGVKTPREYFDSAKFQTIDCHTGGEDNVFPHHENEIAQSEGATNKKFIKYWVHTKHLLVDGQKMSKSLGNFYTLRDIIKKGYNPLALRLLLLGSHYRSQMNFTFKGLRQAQAGLERIKEFISDLSRNAPRPIPTDKRVEPVIKKAQQNFEKYLNDDLNTPQALAVVFDFIRDINKLGRDTPWRVSTKKTIFDLILKFDQVMGLNLDKIQPPKKIKVPQQVKQLLAEREKARRQKDFKTADQFRKEIESLGFKITDTNKEPILKIRE